VLSIGYNGTPRGWDNNCEDDIDGELFTRPEVIHAEMNALMKLASSTETAALSTAYITHAPCLNCAKALYQAGVSRVVYRTGYRNQLGLNFLETCGIPVEQETEHAA
jgi:dCMP deaminase